METHAMAVNSEEVIALYTEKKLTMQQIADRLGITKARVHQILRQAGVRHLNFDGLLEFSVKTTNSIDGGIRQGEPPYRPAAESAAPSAKWPWLTRRRLIVATVSLPLLALVWWFGAYPRGMIAAWIDCSCGHYEVR
jgi:transcriptional regulator with XRE-family HTH domain